MELKNRDRMEQQAKRAGALQEQVRQLGRTGALGEDLKRQVESLAEARREITEALSGF